MTTRWLNDDEERTWRAVRRLMTVLPARVARDLTADSGLSAPDYEVLSTLSEKPKRRWALKDLAAKMEWSRSRLSHHTARMETRGLVAREPDADDARGCILHLTEAGFEALKEAAPRHLDSVRTRFIDHLTPAELRTLERVASRVADLAD
ncbi:MarR family transcriptional regulator [Nocardioides sp. InS609-2]|uniref:MarR family winged helix-turn-helix transcriptional regulator n=1 Tax=Nocardioides sp. InS609-2 TaxID=2760705 RepID=UPI0020BE406C|nr:MarR family transcriptional regulator [Nocardioides sp. InS609-2]